MKLSINDKRAFREGMKNGLPIGLGYFAVSFSLGIAAANAGFTPFQSFLTSFLCNASAGEYAGFSLVAAGASYIEVAIMSFVVNARYLLMSFAMSQRLAPGTKMGHRLLLSNYLTDELFAIAIARDGYMNPYYTYGAVLMAAPFWSVGTAIGTVAGNILPLSLVSAFSVALYGMFIAVIIPPAKQNKVIGVLICICFLLSYLFETLPVISDIASGTRTIILTVVIASAAAILFPQKQNEVIQDEQ